MFGFVYNWNDTKHKTFYVVSHKGSFDDGYVCSSTWMKRSYTRRPYDFKRKILSIITTDRKDLLAEEQRYLNMILEDELGKKYYNLKRNAYGGFTSAAYEAAMLKNKGRTVSNETKKKVSDALKGVAWSEKRRSAQKGSYKRRLKIKYCDIIFNSIEEAVQYAGVSRATVDRWCDKKPEWSKIYVT